MKRGYCPRFCYSSLTIILLLIFLKGNTQEIVNVENDLTRIIEYAEQYLGADDELVNGKIFYQKNLNAEGHPFYLSDEWLTSDIIINGKEHADQRLKYDIENDEVVAIIRQKKGSTYSIVLNKDYLDKFSLNNHLFINNKYLNIEGAKKSFLEQVYKGNISFYSAYNKMFIKQYNNKTPYGKYSKTTAMHFLVDENGTHKIGSKKVLLNHFEANKKAINKYIKDNKIKFNKASADEFNLLIEYCDDLINNH